MNDPLFNSGDKIFFIDDIDGTAISMNGRLGTISDYTIRDQTNNEITHYGVDWDDNAPDGSPDWSNVSSANLRIADMQDKITVALTRYYQLFAPIERLQFNTQDLEILAHSRDYPDIVKTILENNKKDGNFMQQHEFIWIMKNLCRENEIKQDEDGNTFVELRPGIKVNHNYKHKREPLSVTFTEDKVTYQLPKKQEMEEIVRLHLTNIDALMLIRNYCKEQDFTII